MISIKNFVQTDINVISSAAQFEGFRTTLYFASGTVAIPDVTGGNFVTLTSADDVGVKVNCSSAVEKSIQAYFNNGGAKLCFINPTVFTLAGFKNDMYNVTSSISDYYYVCISDGLAAKPSGYAQAVLAEIANFASDRGWSDEDEKSLNQFRLCLTASTPEYVTTNNLLDTKVAVKYSTLTEAGTLVDAAVLIGAYFSKIDVAKDGSIQDYNFTPEFLGNNHFENIDQATFRLLNDNPTNGNYNFIGKVANKIVNIGGDFCSPDDVSMVLDFGASCIERDLDYSLIELLFGKIPLTQEGQAKLIDAMRSQLTKYVDNGFLETNAVYRGDSKSVTYNGKKYNIISNGDILPLGYKIFWVPVSAISAEDRRAKRFPYIYVAMQSVHGARIIRVNGGIL